MNLLLDTNICLALLRSEDYNGMIDFINPGNALMYVSIVSEAELKSIALQNNWNRKRYLHLENFLESISIVEIYQSSVNTYTEIDAFSQRKNLSFKSYSFDTPRNMGKNDLWIASLGVLLGLQLITTDADFNHLNGTFLSVRMIATDELKPFFKSSK